MIFFVLMSAALKGQECYSVFPGKIMIKDHNPLARPVNLYVQS